jgi:hypothetical protein
MLEVVDHRDVVAAEERWAQLDAEDRHGAEKTLFFTMPSVPAEGNAPIGMPRATAARFGIRQYSAP